MPKFRYIDITIGAVSLVLGALFGALVPELFKVGAGKTTWLVGFAIICCYISSLVILLYVPAMVDLASRAQTLVDDALKYRAEIIPRELIYKEMAKCIRRAKKQVAMVTYFMYDWEQKNRNFLPPEQSVEGKDEFYEAVFACIKDSKVEYIRVWGVPAEHLGEALAAITSDPYYKKEIDQIREISVRAPEVARFVIAPQVTTASYILVDQQHLFFNVDFYDEKRKLWHSPYMIFIKDASERAFDGLRSMIVRLTTRES